jgi:hypothetical protein
MNNIKNVIAKNLAAIILVLAPIIYYSCAKKQNEKESANMMLAQNVSSNVCGCYSTSVLDSLPIYFNGNVPGDLAAFNDQSFADCFAWQEFIALNWSTDTSKSFGTPNDLNPVQWETYMPKDVLFQAGGVAPPAWGTLVSDKFAQKFKTQKMLFTHQKTKLLTFSSKFSGSDTLVDLEFGQAAPFNSPNWLGAQNGTNLWYEVMLNKDYYDFIVQKGYYNAQAQHDSVKNGKPIVFPQGVYNGAVGAIELKAAWMEVDNPSSAKWARYKLSLATVLDPTTDKLRTTTVALVGLHILHKTQNQPTWVWATFEQVDNVPGGPNTSPFGFNLNNPKCATKKVTYQNGKSDTTVVVACTPNISPPYYLSQAKPVPIQITRVNAIDPQDATPINAKMQQNIRHFYPNSVFQYYQLVDVIWSQQPLPNPSKPVNAPLAPRSMISGASIVANTSLESYVQSTNTCYSCHQFSNIAPLPTDTANNKKFGDFSFAIGFASYPTNSVKKKK